MTRSLGCDGVGSRFAFGDFFGDEMDRDDETGRHFLVEQTIQSNAGFLDTLPSLLLLLDISEAVPGRVVAGFVALLQIHVLLFGLLAHRFPPKREKSFRGLVDESPTFLPLGHLAHDIDVGHCRIFSADLVSDLVREEDIGVPESASRSAGGIDFASVEQKSNHLLGRSGIAGLPRHTNVDLRWIDNALVDHRDELHLFPLGSRFVVFRQLKRKTS